MTDDELDFLDALASAATPGPWYVQRPKVDLELDAADMAAVVFVATRSGGLELVVPKTALLGDGDPDANALFIAKARAMVPGLVAEVRRLRSEVRFVPANDNPVTWPRPATFEGRVRERLAYLESQLPYLREHRSGADPKLVRTEMAVKVLRWVLDGATFPP